MEAKDIFSFIKNNYKAIFIIAFVVILILFLNQCSSTRKWKEEYKQEQQRSVQNMAALNDSIKYYKNKDDVGTYSKAIAQMSPSELKKYFPDLYKRLEAELGEVKVITHTEIVYRDTGSVHTVLSILDNDHYALNSEYYSSDSSVYIKSSSMFYAKVNFLDDKHSRFTLKITPDIIKYEDLRFKFGLTTGIKKDDDGIYRIFVTPDNDKMTVIDLKGADVSEYFKEQNNGLNKRKRWSVGPNIGYSIVFGKNNQLYHGLSAGVSIQYSIVRF